MRSNSPRHFVPAEIEPKSEASSMYMYSIDENQNALRSLDRVVLVVGPLGAALGGVRLAFQDGGVVFANHRKRLPGSFDNIAPFGSGRKHC